MTGEFGECLKRRGEFWVKLLILWCVKGVFLVYLSDGRVLIWVLA